MNVACNLNNGGRRSLLGTHIGSGFFYFYVVLGVDIKRFEDQIVQRSIDMSNVFEEDKSCTHSVGILISHVIEELVDYILSDKALQIVISFYSQIDKKREKNFW